MFTQDSFTRLLVIIQEARARDFNNIISPINDAEIVIPILEHRGIKYSRTKTIVM